MEVKIEHAEQSLLLHEQGAGSVKKQETTKINNQRHGSNQTTIMN
jgi:hypothetical protein